MALNWGAAERPASPLTPNRATPAPTLGAAHARQRQHRLALRHAHDDEGWTVYLVIAGEAARVNGVPQTGLNVQDADERFEFLNMLEEQKGKAVTRSTSGRRRVNAKSSVQHLLDGPSERDCLGDHVLVIQGLAAPCRMVADRRAPLCASSAATYPTP